MIDVLAATSGGSSGKGGSSIASFLPLLLIVVVGYMLLVRPARNRQRKAAENRTALEPGAEVTTTAGLLATVVSVDGDTVTLEVAPGVHSRYVRAAIARVHPTDEPTLDDHGLDAPEQESIPDPGESRPTDAAPPEGNPPGGTGPDGTGRDPTER